MNDYECFHSIFLICFITPICLEGIMYNFLKSEILTMYVFWHLSFHVIDNSETILVYLLCCLLQSKITMCSPLVKCSGHPCVLVKFSSLKFMFNMQNILNLNFWNLLLLFDDWFAIKSTWSLLKKCNFFETH